jgi:hypothetical protein
MAINTDAECTQKLTPKWAQSEAIRTFAHGGPTALDAARWISG